MRRLSILVVAGCLSVALHAQGSFEVLGIEPSSGPSTGGTEIRIRMNDLPNCPLLPPPPAVFFGTIAVEAGFEDNSFVVTSPPHAPGLVDLTLAACGMDDITIPNGFAYFQQSNPDPQFNVLSITPAFGPTSGGTEVTVEVDDIPFCSDPVPPAGMRFGGVDATNVRENQTANTITAVTPPLPAGIVDVTVTTCGGPTETLTGGFTFTNDAQNPNPAFEKVLFPVLFFGPGARGSQWNTQVSVYNAGDNVITSPNILFRGNPACPAICGCSATSEVNPGMTSRVCTEGFADPSGMIFYAPKSAANDLHYHARISDASRETFNAGTEIPVVREREFRTDGIVLLDVPLDGTPAQALNQLRVAMRVYNPDQIDGAQVQMTILDPGSNQVMGEDVITLSYSIVIQPDDYPNRPSFAFVNDLQQIVRNMIPPQVDVTSFHVKLTPVEPGTRIWAFASITNNETQLVTTITPQH